jgi:hypothetical protein
MAADSERGPMFAHPGWNHFGESRRIIVAGGH